MGLIKALVGSAGGTLADQWREYFYCDSLTADVLAAKGQKRVNASRSSNTKGSDNIISNGSVIAVNEGQCMMIVEQGKIVEFSAEPGEFTYDSSTEHTVFYGGLGKGIAASLKDAWRRMTFGGDTAKDQRVYYFNLKEITDNKYGTANPVPFRVVDQNIGLDIDIGIRCHGVFSYKIVDPTLFYKNVCGNVASVYNRSEIDSMLKAELLSALQPAFAKISDMGIRYSALPGHTMEISDALNEVLSAKWTELRGLKVASFAVSSVTASKEDEDMIKELQRTAVLRNPNMAAATLAGAQAEAMKTAAGNKNGAMMGFMGMNMANMAGGMNTNTLFTMGQQAAPAQAPAAPREEGWVCSCGQKGNTGKFCMNCGEKKPEPKPADGSWTCVCGAVNTGKFCMECGSPKPAEGWTCTCGTVNKGKFCINCGSKKPAGEPLYRCDKCGWEPADPKHPPKFCPECGDIFDDSDVTNK